MTASGVRPEWSVVRRFSIASGIACCAMMSACATTRAANAPVGLAGVQNVVSDRLVFGQSIPGGGMVSDTAWAAFLRDVITPRFPSGLTVWHADGQWLDSRGATEHESTIVVELLHVRGDPADSVFAAIASAYVERFHQDAVLRITSDAKTQLYESSRSKDRAALEKCEKSFARRVTAPISDSAMLGDYDLRMVAEDASLSGESVVGRLELHRIDSTYAARVDTTRRDTRGEIAMFYNTFYEPVVGTAAIDLQLVGARTTGNLGSTDAAAPGAFLQRSQPVLQLGGLPVAFDGAGTGLLIIGGDPVGFWGTWSSWIAIANSRTHGRFCAIRRA